jgi:hypothetical protein
METAVQEQLAVVGMIVLGAMLLLVTFGPPIWYWMTGITPDYIPADKELLKSFPPSLEHPMGTDEQGAIFFLVCSRAAAFRWPSPLSRRSSRSLLVSHTEQSLVISAAVSTT